MRKFTSFVFVSAALSLFSACATQTSPAVAITSAPMAAAPAPVTAPKPIVAAVPAPAPTVKAASTGGNSPHETTSATIGRGGPRVTITYGRPYSVKPGTTEARKIWGGLVPWGKADRMGSDEATLLLTEQPLQIGETTIPAGAYTLYIVPSETGASKLAFSTRLGKWGIPVDETHDFARVDLVKEALPQTLGQLTIKVESVPAGGGVIKIQWENTQFSLPFAIKK